MTDIDLEAFAWFFVSGFGGCSWSSQKSVFLLRTGGKELDIFRSFFNSSSISLGSSGFDCDCGRGKVDVDCACTWDDVGLD